MNAPLPIDAELVAPNQGGRAPSSPNASRYAVMSSIASVIVILASGFATACFLSDVNVTIWWAPTTVLLVVALAVAALAQNCLPPEVSQRGNALRAWVATAWLMFVAAGVVFALTFLPMQLLLYARSPEGRAALQEARKQQQIALQGRQIAVNRQAQINDAYQRDLASLDRELSSLKRQANQLAKDAENKEAQTLLAEKKQAEKQRDLTRTSYQQAVLGTLFDADPQRPLPVFAAEDVAWGNPKRSIESSYQQLQSAATPQPLFAEEQTTNGLTVRCLKLRGSDFIPKIGLFSTPDQAGKDQVFISLVTRSGEELEISATDWRLQRTTNLGDFCDDLSYSGATLYVAQQQANRILTVRHETEDTRGSGGDGIRRLGSAYKIISPQRIAANNSTSNIQVATDTSTPMLAEMTQGELTKVRELRPGSVPATARFLPGQLGQDVFLNGDREIFVAQADGIYRAQLSQPPVPNRLPAHRTESNGGYITLDGEQFVAFQHRWPVQSLAWQKVIPAAGIDVNLFATFGADLLATANAQTNLLLYDRQGKLLSRHNWPNAGKTLGIAGLRERDALVVFTEQSIFVVSSGQRERPSQNVDLATNSPRTPAAPSRLTTIAQIPQPTSEAKNIAGSEYEIAGAKVRELKFDSKQWAWGDTAEHLFALRSGVLSKINTKTRTIERSITLAKENYGDLALTRTKSRLLVLMPEQKQLVALAPATLDAKTFAIDDFEVWSAKASMGLAASPRVEWFALLSGKESDSRIDVVDPRDGKILWSVTPGELKPPPTELGWFAIGPDDNSLVCMPQNRLCWIRFSGKTWQQSPVAADFNTKWVNATPLVWPATGCVYWGAGRNFNGFNLMKPGEPAPVIQSESNTTIEFDPSGKFFWTNQIKKIEVATQKELASYPLQKRASSFARSPDPKILRSGTSIVELTAP